MSKPKKIGEVVNDFTERAAACPSPEHAAFLRSLKTEHHPVYEYRGFIIGREYGTSNTPSTIHYNIYREFTDGKTVGYDYSLNVEDGFKRLQWAVDAIDAYLKERESRA